VLSLAVVGMCCIEFENVASFGCFLRDKLEKRNLKRMTGDR